MPLIKPNIPSSPPLPRPKLHFGDEGTPTPISSRLPQSSSAGSTINSGGSSRPGDPSPLRGSAAGNTDPISSPLPPKRPGSPELPNDRFKATEQQIKAYDGKKRPDLTDYFAEDGGTIQDLRKDSDGNLYFIDEHDHSFRAEFYEDDVTRVMIPAPHRVNDPIFLRLFDDGHYRQVNSWLPEPSSSPQLPLSLHQSGPSTAPKRLWRPWSPDGAQPSPPKRPKVDEGMSVADMPPELTRGSGNFWRKKASTTRQSAVNLFRDGKIRDVTYGNGGKEMSGKLNYMGNEYQFFFPDRDTYTVAFRDIEGNVAKPVGISGQHFSDFLHTLEGKPTLLIERAPVPPRSPIMMKNMPNNFSIPNELSPPAPGSFWGTADRSTRSTQFLLTELYRNKEIYGINFGENESGNLRLNAVMRYQGRDYSFSVGKNYQIIFSSRDLPLGFHDRQHLFDALYILAGQTLT